MKLENITITGTINGEPVMVMLDNDQIAMLPSLIAACDKTNKCRVAKLDPKEYTLSKPSFANVKGEAQPPETPVCALLAGFSVVMLCLALAEMWLRYRTAAIIIGCTVLPLGLLYLVMAILAKLRGKSDQRRNAAHEIEAKRKSSGRPDTTLFAISDIRRSPKIRR